MMFPQTAHLPVLQQHPSATPFSWIPAWQCGVPPSLSFLLFLLMEVQHLVHKPVGPVGGRESCPKEGCGEKLGWVRWHQACCLELGMANLPLGPIPLPGWALSLHPSGHSTLP